MKWFKHMSDASDDEFTVAMEDEFGLEGYARYWKLLEAVATKMDETSRCSLAYSWDKWQAILKGKRKKLETFLVYLENKSKIKLKQNGNILEIEIPNLLKIRDNHTKNLQVKNKLLPSQDIELDIDKENYSSSNTVGNCTGADGQSSLPPLQNLSDLVQAIPDIPQTEREWAIVWASLGFSTATIRHPDVLEMIRKWIKLKIAKQIATEIVAWVKVRDNRPITSPVYFDKVLNDFLAKRTANPPPATIPRQDEPAQEYLKPDDLKAGWQAAKSKLPDSIARALNRKEGDP